MFSLSSTHAEEIEGRLCMYVVYKLDLRSLRASQQGLTKTRPKRVSSLKFGFKPSTTDKNAVGDSEPRPIRTNPRKLTLFTAWVQYSLLSNTLSKCSQLCHPEC